MSESPIQLRGKSGGVVFDGTQSPGGGSSPGGQALYSDGSDGDVDVTASGFDWPDPTPVSAWQNAHAYAVGDQVKTTGTHVRIYECISPGTSGGSTPFADDIPGASVRGRRQGESGNVCPVWEQVTQIIGGYLEGPLFADNFTLRAGATLHAYGWPIFARTQGETEATSVLDSSGFDAAGAVASTLPTDLGNVSNQRLLGFGIDGVGPDSSGQAGSTWGGGIGGQGGTGTDSATPTPPGSTDTGNLMVARTMTFTRHMIPTIFGPYYAAIHATSAVETIGSSGGGGSSDTGAGKSGGASGSAGSGFALFAKTLIHDGLIDCSGGAGGAGEAGGNTGGGGGGGGGCCVLAYDTKTGTGTVTVDGGAGGAKQGTGTAGAHGGPGEFVEFANAA